MKEQWDHIKKQMAGISRHRAFDDFNAIVMGIIGEHGQKRNQRENDITKTRKITEGRTTEGLKQPKITGNESEMLCSFIYL